MPGKYSHGVVLAGYSSRGIISLPNDKQLDYFKSASVGPPACGSTTTPRAPSAPPTHGHPQAARPAATKTSKEAKRHSSTISPDYTVPFRDLEDNEGTEARQTLRRRKGTVDIPRENGKRSVDTTVFCNVGDGKAVSNVARTGSSEKKSKPTLKSPRKHTSALAAQKYVPRDGRRYPSKPQKETNTRSRRSESLDGNSNGPLLSVHEFLDSVQEANPRDQSKTEHSRFAATELHIASTTVWTPAQVQSHQMFSDVAKHRSNSLLNRGNMSFIDMSDDEEQVDVVDKNHTAPVTANSLPPGPSSYTVGRRQHILDLTEEDDDFGIATAPIVQSISRQELESAGLSHKAAHAQFPTIRPDLVLADNHHGELVLPVQKTPPSTKQKVVGMNDGTSPVMNVRNSLTFGQNAARTEPDSSRLPKNDRLYEIGGDSAVDMHTHGYHDRVTERRSSSRGPRLQMSPSSSSYLHEETESKHSRTSSFAGVKTIPFGRKVNGDEKAPSGGSEAAGSAMSPQEVPTTPTASFFKKQVQKLNSEEEMRLKIPTPIPSPTASRKSSSLVTSKTQWRPPQRSATEDFNFGVPSIVRSPPKQNRRLNGTTMFKFDSQDRSNSLGMFKFASQDRSNSLSSQTISLTTPPRNGTQLRRSRARSVPRILYPNIDSETVEGLDVGNRSWISPSTPEPRIDSLRNEPASHLTVNLDSDSQSGSGEVTPRPQTAHRIPPPQSHSQTAPLPPKTLMTAFDDISSTSSVRYHGHQEGMSDDEDLDYSSRQVDQGGDPEAAPSPPDISRYPAVRNSARATKATEGRLSSLTRRTWKKERPGKTKLANPEPDDRLDTIVWTLNTRSRSLSQLGLRGEESEAGAGTGDVSGGSGLSPGFGPGRPSGVDRLEAMMLKADEEARAKRSIRAVWDRFKRRIEG